MTDIEALRRALQAPDDAGSVDIGEIVTRGKRLRVRRRLAVAGAAMCAALVVTGVVTGGGHLVRSAPVPAQHPTEPRPARSVSSPSPAPRVTPSSAMTTPSPSPSASR
jgi:hypothetical protein